MRAVTIRKAERYYNARVVFIIGLLFTSYVRGYLIFLQIGSAGSCPLASSYKQRIISSMQPYCFTYLSRCLTRFMSLFRRYSLSRLALYPSHVRARLCFSASEYTPGMALYRGTVDLGRSLQIYSLFLKLLRARATLLCDPFLGASECCTRADLGLCVLHQIMFSNCSPDSWWSRSYHLEFIKRDWFFSQDTVIV